VFVGADDGEGGVSEHGEGAPAGPGRVTADLVFIHSGQALTGLECLFHSPPASRAPDPSAPVRLLLEAEILTCADTGRPELLISIGDRLYEVGTADELRAAITTERAKLDQLAALANHYEALTAIPAAFDDRTD
jgi:hypothetical protein